MADVSIVGAAGYTGQETLDRVLGHPELASSRSAPTRSRGSREARSTHASPHAAMPAFVTNEAALAHGADVTILCLSHEAAAAIEAPPPVSSSTSRAPTGCGTPPRTRPGTASRTRVPAGLGDWVYGLPELVAESGRLIANPGCYATADPARARAAEGCDRARLRRRRRPLRDDGSGPHAEGRPPTPASVLENVAPYRVGAHQHVPEIAQLLGFPVSFTPHLLPVRRGLIATCNVRSTGA